MRFGSAPLAMRVAVPAMVRRDAVVDAQIDADTGRNGFLSDRDMQGTWDFARLCASSAVSSKARMRAMVR